MSNFNLSVLLVVIGLSSCASLKSVPETTGRAQLNDLSSLNGFYAVSSGKERVPTLDYCLTFNEYFNYKNKPQPTDLVQLVAEGNNKLLVSVYRGDSLIYTRSVKGKLEDNYFKAKQFRFSPFWLIVSRTKIKKARIGKLPNGDLVVDERYDLTGYFLFIPFGGVDDTNPGIIYKQARPIRK